LAVEVRVESFRAHLRYLLHLAVVHVVEEAAQVGTGVQALQLLLVQGYHLVDAPFVLELEVSDRTVEGIVAQSALLVQKLPGLAVLRRAKQSIIEAFFQFLGQRGQTLLLDVPHELVPRKLEALLHVEFRNVDPDQKVALVGASFALLLHPGLDVHMSTVELLLSRMVGTVRSLQPLERFQVTKCDLASA
jgi:hypothetical protein